MKVNIFKKLIREVVREELDYKFSALEKKLDEVLVSNGSDVIVEDKVSQPTASPTKKVPVPAAKANGQAAPPLTKDSVLNDIKDKERKNLNKLENVIDKADLQAKYGKKQGQGIQGAEQGVEG